MDAYSSGEDLVIKTRKPYTITKQRERWTEEEHNRFLEALKLYGRAWQRIEEHIGTKTAVQIRSHAQKFFSKLEKEAVAKGVPIGQAIDIDIPPPRPKRKPSNPYPRKTSISPTALQVGAKDGKLPTPVSFPPKQVFDLEKEPLPEKQNGEEKLENGKENQDDNCSGVFTLLQDVRCSSVSSVNKNSISTPEAARNSCSFREFVPSLKDAINKDATNGSYVTTELDGNQKLGRPDAEKTLPDGTNMVSKMENSHPVHEKFVQGKKSDELGGALATEEMQSMQNYPRHVPVHVLDGSLGSCMQTPTSDMSFQDSVFHPVREVHTHSNMYSHPAASANTEHHNNVPRSSMHQTFPSFPPFTSTHHNHDDYRSFLHMSTTFSSLIVSTLLQNPTAHAAASFAASFWPYANVESSADSPACNQGNFAPRQINSAPSMAAIAAATVAAATAWWAAHGLLPLCAPLHAAFTCPPAAGTVAPQIDIGQIHAAKTDKKETTILNTQLQDQQLDAEQSEAVHAQNAGSKSPLSSSSEAEESGGPKLDSGSKANDQEKPAAAPETHDSSKTKSRKQVDRSSCGSNSSSEVETEALNHDKDEEELKEADVNHAALECSGRRSRSSSNSNDSRKEVSEEGRLAFQALFSRERLPQSFSPPHDQKNKAQKDQSEGDEQMEEEKDGDASLLDLNGKTCGSDFCHHGAENDPSPRSETSRAGEEGLPTIGLGNAKLKARRTGFKPYKRCSVEAKESRVMNTSSHCEEKCPKRIRLEGEAST